MQTKLIEVRDEGTFIPMLTVKLEPGNESENYLLARAGYSRGTVARGEFVLLASLSGGKGQMTCDPYDWPDSRTRQTVHSWLLKNFGSVESGQVVDVQFILGETKEPKQSEQFCS